MEIYKEYKDYVIATSCEPPDVLTFHDCKCIVKLSAEYSTHWGLYENEKLRSNEDIFKMFYLVRD